MMMEFPAFTLSYWAFGALLAAYVAVCFFAGMGAYHAFSMWRQKR